MKKVLIALVGEVLTGCGGGGDESTSQTTVANPLDKFVGEWRVSYTGADRGNCLLQVPVPTNKITVPVSGTCKSTLSGISFTVTGQVDSLNQPLGKVIANSNTGVTLVGDLTGTSGTGTWFTKVGVAPSGEGNWTATR